MSERFPAQDGFSLAGDWFGAEAPRAVAVVASAMGVPRRIYRHLAGYLAERGIATLTFDYRGVGESRPASLRGFRGSLGDWATLDIPGAVAYVRARHPDLPLAYVGHSMGGQLLGLSPVATQVGAALFVASQSGYWRYWSPTLQPLILAHWYGVVPILSRLFGYLPMRRVLGGEDVPREAGLDWARWGRHPRYVLSDVLAEGGASFARLRAPLRAYAFTDDRLFGPVRGVRELTSYYGNATPRDVVALHPRDLGLRSIGHFNWLKPAFRDPIWRPVTDWLLTQVSAA